MAEITIELAVHKNVDPEEDTCEGNLAQNIMGNPKCNECDKMLKPGEMTNPGPETAQTLMWGLVVGTDTVVKEIMGRMKNNE